MKKQLLKVVCLGFLVVAALVLLARSGLAQQTGSFTVRANVPFEFVVRGETMPAGDYLVQIPSAPAGPMMIQQKKGSGSGFVIQLPIAETWSGKPQLVFRQVGGTLFLFEIRDPRVGVHRISQSERYLLARKSGPEKEVVVEGK